MAEIERRLMTRAEVAQLLALPEKTLVNWRYQGFGPPSFRVGKAVRYRRDEVERWLDEQAASTGGSAA
jgi:predicted DNA-binding transcriptional regulator AlpA